MDPKKEAITKRDIKKGELQLAMKMKNENQYLMMKS